jgi:hypothetical protein
MKEQKTKFLKYKIETFPVDDEKENPIWYFSSLKDNILTDFYLYDESQGIIQPFESLSRTSVYSEHIGESSIYWIILEDTVEWISDCSTLELIKEQYPELFI